CSATGSVIETVQQNPLSEDARKNLRESLSGTITGARSLSDENRFELTNTGWVSKRLHLELSPIPPSRYGFKVTSSLIGPEEEITSSKRDLELPPCQTAQLSVVSLHWYESFPEPVTFEFNPTEATLKANVIQPGLAWQWIIIGASVVFVGL